MKLSFDTDDGIGTRATLGVIVLETDETLEPEFSRMVAADGIALYHGRIPMAPDIRSDTLARMEADLPAAARLLPSSADFDVIGYGCTSAASVIGSGAVARAVRSVFPRARVTDPLAAIIAAGRALGVTRLGFLTPYVPQVSQRVRRRLEEAGFSIGSFASFEEGDDRVVARISERSIAEAAGRVAPGSEAVVIACTNLRCLRIIPRVEARTGLPVIASNQALAWHMLRLAGVNDAQTRFGRLFARRLADPPGQAEGGG